MLCTSILEHDGVFAADPTIKLLSARQALRDGGTLKMALRSILIMVAVLSLTTAGVAAGARVAGGAPAAPSSQQQVR